MNSQEKDRVTIYAFAHVESWIESYAKSTGQSAGELAARVGTLLLAQGAGTPNSVPPVSSYPAGVRKSLGKVAVAKRAPGRMPVAKLKTGHHVLSASARKRIGAAQRKRWATLKRERRELGMKN